MKNKIIYVLKSKVYINVKGKNINRFITRLYNNKIEILKCVYVNDFEVNIIIYKKDFKRLNDIKTIYEVDNINSYGLVKIKKNIGINKYIIISLILGYVLFRFLTNIIFSVEVIYNDSGIRDFIKNELSLCGIKEKSFKKSFDEIQSIKHQILEKYKDKIEWLEIEEVGTRYVVRLELRIISDPVSEKKLQNVIAGKDSIIRSVFAKSGQIVKDVNNYVKKGDVIISGNIYDNDVIKDVVAADGLVFGEVWYDVTVTYPFVYNEVKETGNKKDAFVFEFLNKSVELFNFKPFKDKKVYDNVIFKNYFIPIRFVYQNQVEVQRIDQVLLVDEASKLAISKAVNQMNDRLSSNEYIIDYKVLDINVKESEVEVNVFFSVYENITDYEVIVEESKE